jgi:hypothetical protein
MGEDPLSILQQDPLGQFESLGINAHMYEALQRGDLRTAIVSMLLEQNPDPQFAALMQFMLARDHGAVAGTAGQEAVGVKTTSRDGRPDAARLSTEDGRRDVRATFRHIAMMLGACTACCGEDASCPDCHGSGKPGSAPSIASSLALRAWLEPLFGRMGMHITNPALPVASPHEDPLQPISA